MPISKFGYVDDKEPILARRSDRIIIAILGGSVACHFAAINGVAKLGAELSRSPEFAGKEVVFVNLALSGYKQPQQLMTLAYLLSLERNSTCAQHRWLQRGRALRAGKLRPSYFSGVSAKLAGAHQLR